MAINGIGWHDDVPDLRQWICQVDRRLSEERHPVNGSPQASTSAPRRLYQGLGLRDKHESAATVAHVLMQPPLLGVSR